MWLHEWVNEWTKERERERVNHVNTYQCLWILLTNLVAVVGFFFLLFFFQDGCPLTPSPTLGSHSKGWYLRFMVELFKSGLTQQREGKWGWDNVSRKIYCFIDFLILATLKSSFGCENKKLHLIFFYIFSKFSWQRYAKTYNTQWNTIMHTQKDGT